MSTETYLGLSVKSAREGIENGEGGPFGACVVKDNSVIAVAHNTVLKDNDPTCHAEMNAIRKACKQLGSYVLEGCELYTTSEPCPMCLAAILWARIDTVFVGASRELAAKYGFDDVAFYEEIANLRRIDMESNLLPEDVEALFKRWESLSHPMY